MFTILLAAIDSFGNTNFGFLYFATFMIDCVLMEHADEIIKSLKGKTED